MDVPLHKYWEDMSPLSHRDRRPYLRLQNGSWVIFLLLVGGRHCDAERAIR